MRKGTDFEDKAADYLLTLGYTILTRRFKGREGEIDLVALDGETLVFVEVKSRTTGWGTPEEAVTGQKQRRLWAVANQYVFEFGLENTAARFDVIAFDQAVIRHYENAFDGSL